MRSILVALTALILCWPAALEAREAGRTVQLPESLAVTPDGRVLVFSWHGDLWRAPIEGGDARRLTFHPAEDTRPHVSPDGTRIAFVSTRSGAEQVHVMPLAGGTPTQVTMHSEGARVYGWFPDGEAVLIRSQRDHHWRDADRLFRKPLSIEEPPELLFDAATGHGAISPDGRRVAFTREGMGWTRKGYRGPRASQLWLYDLQAKTFRKLSEGTWGELWPMWGADANTLHYVSEEDGTWNLWTRDLATGKRSRLTHHLDDGATWPSISADGGTIVYRRLFDIHRVHPGKDAKPARVVVHDRGDPSIDPLERRTVSRATAVAFTEDAREIALVAGGDLWVMDTELREPKQITNTAEEERDPVFSQDFETLWVITDAGGQTDIWRIRRGDPEKYWWQNETFEAKQVTDDDGVESDLRLTPDGKRLAYIENGSLWSMAVDGSDNRLHAEGFLGVQWSFSPDGRWVAYAKPDDDFNWDIWIVPADGSAEPVNVSQHPDNDMGPAWSPDGRILAFTGRRWTEETDICYVWLRAEDDETDKQQRTLEKALKKMAGRKKGGGKAKPKADPKAAAPGDKPAAGDAEGLAGLWRGRLQGPPPLPEDGVALSIDVRRTEDGWTCDIDVVGQFSGRAETFTVDEASGTIRFALSTPIGPLQGEGKLDGREVKGTWKVEGVMEGTFAVSRAAGDAAKEDEAPKAAAKPDEAEKPKTPAVEPVEIDFEGLEDRIKRISIPDGAERELFWSHDGKKLAFQSSVSGKAGLYTVTFPDGLQPKLLTTARGSNPRWLKEGNQIVWLSGGKPAAVNAAGRASSWAFSVRQEVSLPDLHRAVFDQAWRTMRDTYYDPALGNRDWDAVREKYGAMAGRCLTTEEVSLVINMMLGELNGSHLGFRASSRGWQRPGWRDVTGHIGCRFDPAFAGPGLKVAEVIDGTPADEARSKIEVGEIILAIDGRPVGPETWLDELLTGDPARTIELHVQAADGEKRMVSMRPTTYGAVRGRLYETWIDATRRDIEERSEGKVGYLHVRSMNWSSFQRFETELYKAGHGKDALIIDVRDNGGGFTTDHLLTSLVQPRHAITVPRRGGKGYPHDRMVYAPWHKPVVVLCNQNSFSNAEIFSHAIKNLGRGKVVGVETAGGVISTGGTTIMGFGSLRLPFRGWYVAKTGEDMELNGCVPHHTVWPEPADHAAGRDRQVEKAVAVALEEVAAWKARPRPELRKASEREGFGGR